MADDSLLSQVRVDNPCPKRWGEMTGDDARRFCDTCQKHVHNLSALTAPDAERLLRDSAGNLCVRYKQDAQGGVVTRPEPAPPGGPWHRRWLRRAAGFLLAAQSLFLTACAGAVRPTYMDTTTGVMVAPTPEGQAPADAQPSATSPTPATDTTASAPATDPDEMVLIGDPGVFVEGKAEPAQQQGTKPQRAGN